MTRSETGKLVHKKQFIIKFNRNAFQEAIYRGSKAYDKWPEWKKKYYKV